MPRLCISNGRQCNVLIERGQAAAMLDGQGQQVQIRDLVVAAHAIEVDPCRISQADVIGPERCA